MHTQLEFDNLEKHREKGRGREEVRTEGGRVGRCEGVRKEREKGWEDGGKE